MFNDINEIASAIQVRNYVYSILDNTTAIKGKDNARKMQEYLKSLEAQILDSFCLLMSVPFEDLGLSGKVPLTSPNPVSLHVAAVQQARIVASESELKFPEAETHREVDQAKLDMLKAEFEKSLSKMPEVKKSKLDKEKKKGSFRRVDDES